MMPPGPLHPTAALFIDVDGTLLEIAPRPELVVVPSELAKLLARLAGQRGGAMALVSGRPLAEIDHLFAPWRGSVAGLHGAERRRADRRLVVGDDSPADRAAEAALERLRPSFAVFAEKRPGLWLEDKGRTLALHYREAPEREDEVRAFAERGLATAGDSLRLIAGKMVVELQPRHLGKGGAIAAFLGEAPFIGRIPVFLGDDTTDEDGFAEVNRRGGVSIRVGPQSPDSAARFALPSVEAVLHWLRQGAGV